MDDQKQTLDCFVIMPSGNRNEYRGATREARYVYKHLIKNTINSVANDLNCSIKVSVSVRNNKPAIITNEIVRHLETADLVIADLTGLNPNVYHRLQNILLAAHAP